MAVRRRRKSKHIMSDDSSDDSSAESSASTSSDSESESSSSSESDSSASSSSESDSSDDSGSDEGTSGPDFDDSVFPNEDPKKSVEEIRELIRDAKVMKYENAIIEKAGVDNYASLRNCDEKKLKKLGMGYTDRDRLLKAFRTHIEGIIEQNRERWERQKELKSGKSKKTTKNSKSKSKSKSTKNGKDKKRAKSKSSKSSKTSSKSSKTKGKTKTEVDPDEALKKIDDGWSGKKQAWKDYKLHEARVAELMEFYDEIGKKRANGEEHARRLLLSYPGGIHKLVIALDKKYHHIPYGWEELLEEAYRVQEYEGNGTD